jgi:DNA-binding NarL/FixJ family response regulator
MKSSARSGLAITVTIIEDNQYFLGHFASIVQEAGDMELIGTASTVKDAIALIDSVAADVYLVDLGLPDASGIEVIRYLRERRPESEAMVITVFGDEQNVVTSIEAGATGYLLKDSPADNIAEAIREMHDGGSSITPVIARKLLQRLQPGKRAAHDPGALTDREATILTGLAKGMTYKEIAAQCHIAVGTVSHHVKSIYGKLQVHSRSEAVFEAARRGILSI